MEKRNNDTDSYLVRSGRTERKRHSGVSAGYKNGRVKREWKVEVDR